MEAERKDWELKISERLRQNDEDRQIGFVWRKMNIIGKAINFCMHLYFFRFVDSLDPFGEKNALKVWR